VQEGPLTNKSFIISAKEPEILADKIFQHIDRGVTFLNGRGGYTGESRDLILCVVDTREAAALRDLVYEHDARAFMLINDAYEVLGEGFASVEKAKK
jgi:uncharacterized membrane-anchored protein YitT (DUF2179 family)